MFQYISESSQNPQVLQDLSDSVFAVFKTNRLSLSRPIVIELDETGMSGNGLTHKIHSVDTM